MRRFLIILILLQYITSIAVAGKPRPFSPDQVIYLTAKPGVKVLAYKDYEDIRIDSDQDGKIDYWEIRKGSYNITYIYKNGKVQALKIRKTEEKKVKELVYTFGMNQNKKLSERDLLVMNGVLEPLCKEEKQVFKDLASFSAKLDSSNLNQTLENYLDDSCFNLEPSSLNNLKRSLGIIIRSEQKEQDSLQQCIQSESTAKELKVNDSESTLGLKVLAAKYALQMKRLSQDDESSKGLIVCEQSSKFSTVEAHYKEGGKITVQFPTKWNGSISSILSHEFIHRAGLTDEKFTTELTRICSQKIQSADKGKASNSGEFNLIDTEHVGASANSAAKSSSADTKVASNSLNSQKNNHNKSATITNNDNALNELAFDLNANASNATTKTGKTSQSRAPASETGGGSTGVDMKSEIAQAQAVAPSAEKLAQIKVDKSPEGIQAAVKESVAESTPVLRMANQVMGASSTPALASSDEGGGSGGGSGSSEIANSSGSASSYEPSYSSGSSSSSDSGSKRRYQSKNGRYQSPSETVASDSGPKVITGSRNGLAPGERIVKEVDLTKGTNFRASNAPAPTRGQQGNTREVSAARTAAGSREPASAVPAAPSNPGGEIASPGPISGGGSFDGGSIGGGSGLGNTTTNSPAPAQPQAANRRVSGNRGPASSGNTQSNAATSREEVVTFLSSGSYNFTKNKLRDAGFVNSLKTNKVTIIDLYGNSFGASRGDIIFLDDGDKFVRQK